jgi:hypothetical protein
MLISAPQAKNLIYNSKMSAKVDSALVQDGFDLYHHAFFFSRNGAWTVVQQGMNKEKRSARRYHWYSKNINDLVAEPHSGISSPVMINRVLDLTAAKSDKTREISTELVQNGYAPLMKDITLLRKYSSRLSQMAKIQIGSDGRTSQQLTLLNLETREFKYHPVVHEDFAKSKYLEKILALVADRKPDSYESLLSIGGVGGKTMRALALVGEVIYGATPSYEDPARYSFAHGGKDATPYPVDTKTYDETIAMLANAVRKTHLPLVDKQKAIGRLNAS